MDVTPADPAWIDDPDLTCPALSAAAIRAALPEACRSPPGWREGQPAAAPAPDEAPKPAARRPRKHRPHADQSALFDTEEECSDGNFDKVQRRQKGRG